jgi:predicted nuclease with RNAse H fold
MIDQTVYIGVDPTAGRRALTYAILDASMRIIQMRTASFDRVVATVLSYPSAVCGVDAPLGTNSGLLADPSYRAEIGLEPHGTTYTTYRVCEYELRRRGIYIYNTPGEDADLSDWILGGQRLYNVLMDNGYVVYPEGGRRRLFETYPYAAFTVLGGTSPYAKASLEGRLQRQAILHREGVNVPDPMRVLQEITRHRLLTGRLNLSGLYNEDELDALAAAYTAFLVDLNPAGTTAVGDETEGRIVVPTAALQDAY